MPAREQAAATGQRSVFALQTGDILSLPFADRTFDSVLSTHSLCPLDDPVAGATELWRVLRDGGRLGIAHSADPGNAAVRWPARGVEAIAWRFPFVSLACRPVSARPALRDAGATVIAETRLGPPLWPFHAFVVEKPRPQ